MPRETKVRGAAVAVFAIAAGALVGADGSPLWRMVRMLIVFTVAATTLHLLTTRRRGASVALVLVGLAGVVMGIGIGARHAQVVGLAWRSVAGLAALAAGAVLVVAGVRGATGDMTRRRRVATVAGSVVALLVALWVLVPGVLTTNVPPTELGSARLSDHGVVASDVEYRAADGTRMSAWYVPSTNGAAVVLRHGAGSTRTSVVAQAVVLADHGYGVLLTDARGHGRSDGRAMDFGWNGDADISAAVDFLVAQPDVDPTQIGVVGMSMGGEEAVGAAAADERIVAVVAEGATGRTNSDKAWLDDSYGWRGRLQQGIEWAQFAFTDLLTDAPRPSSLASSAAAATQCSFLLIAGGDVHDEPDAAAFMRDAAPDRVTVWTVPGSAHTQGLDTAPDEWESHVIGFLDEHLLVPTTE
ncbi:MAG: alpha/beta fold hydrolase [Actinomycetota bacterium]|nr:alpha/beta fold hydrolase [Actinomycetota bacterium]